MLKELRDILSKIKYLGYEKTINKNEIISEYLKHKIIELQELAHKIILNLNKTQTLSLTIQEIEYINKFIYNKTKKEDYNE